MRKERAAPNGLRARGGCAQVSVIRLRIPPMQGKGTRATHFDRASQKPRPGAHSSKGQCSTWWNPFRPGACFSGSDWPMFLSIRRAEVPGFQFARKSARRFNTATCRATVTQTSDVLIFSFIAGISPRQRLDANMMKRKNTLYLLTATTPSSASISGLSSGFSDQCTFTVSAFLRRVGRTGRRGSPPEMRFVMLRESGRRRKCFPLRRAVRS